MSIGTKHVSLFVSLSVLVLIPVSLTRFPSLILFKFSVKFWTTKTSYQFGELELIESEVLFSATVLIATICSLVSKTVSNSVFI